MNRRSYGQYCGLAVALDIIGERWSALIIRDLAIRQRRFKDLLDGLSGLGTSLLSERLRHLEEAGLIERAIGERAAGGGVVYRLTQEGVRVADALAPLAMWGATRVGGQSAAFRPDWLMFVLKSSFKAALARGVDDCYEFRIDGQSLWVVVKDGLVDVTTEQPRSADFIATLSLPTLAAIGAGALDPLQAAADGAANYDGDPDAGVRALRLLGSTPAKAPSTRKVAKQTQSASGAATPQRSESSRTKSASAGRVRRGR